MKDTLCWSFIFYLSLLSLFFSTSVIELNAFPKDREECRIKATIAQDTNIIYDVDLTPQSETLIVGPEYYNLSTEEKEEVVEAYNCMLVAYFSKDMQEKTPRSCINFSLKDYKSNIVVASFQNCEFLSK